MTDRYGNIVNDFMKKIESMFGKEILIINCKAKQFLKAETFKYMDLSIYFDLLGFVVNKGSPYKQLMKDNYLACDLFFQATYQNKDMGKAINTFYSYFVPKLSNLNDLSLDSLRLIFNIIEFEHEFKKFSQSEIEKTLNLLVRFENEQKPQEMAVLYKYYKGLLLLFLKDFNQSHLEVNEINSILKHIINSNNNELMKYIKARTILLNLEISRQAPSFNINEYCALASILYNTLKKEYKLLAVKTGITIFNVYQKKFQMQNCINILTEMLSLIKEEMYTGSNVENGMEYYLAISLRLAYCYTMTEDTQSLLSSIKKIEKTIGCFPKQSPQKTAIEFMLMLYKYITKTNLLTKEKSNEVLTSFKQRFLVNNQSDLFKIYFPIEEEAYIDIFAINSVDASSSTKVNNIIKEYSQQILSSKDVCFISLNKIVAFFFALYNYISNYSLSILNDPSESNQKKCKDNIKKSCEILLVYLNKMFDLNPMLQVELIKDLIVKIYFCYLNCFSQRNEINEKINHFDKFIVKILNINLHLTEGNIEGMAYIYKFKGDFYFKEKKRDMAIEQYQKSIKIMGVKNKANAGVILCNIGLCYLLNGSKQEAFRYLNLSLNKFNGLAKTWSDNTNIPDSLNRLKMANFIDEKIKLLNQVLDLIKA